MAVSSAMQFNARMIWVLTHVIVLALQLPIRIRVKLAMPAH
jgi:hypothetical protein